MMRFALKKIHYAFIVVTLGVAVSPPAQASLMQVIKLFKTFLTVNLGGFNAIKNQEAAGAQAQTNAIQQSTEVLGGVLADQTKTLGQLQYELNFKGSGRFNTVAATGCMFLDKGKDKINRAYEERVENTATNDMKVMGEYAQPNNPTNIEEDKQKRKAIRDIVKDSDFPLEGIFPNKNITPSQRAVWTEYVKHLTVPGPVNITGLTPNPGDKVSDAFRFKQLVAPVQKVLLSYGDKYTAEKEGADSRMDVFKRYKATVYSDRRVESTTYKSKAGVERDAALAQAMLLDVENEIMETNRSITELISVLTILETDKMADDL